MTSKVTSMENRGPAATIETMIMHGKIRPSGRPAKRSCPGMWVIEYDDRGLVATCNECHRVRNLTEFLDVEPSES